MRVSSFRLALTLACAALAFGAAAGEIPTAAPDNIDPFFDGARRLQVLDWDQDGDLDLVGGAFDGQDISVWRNQQFGWLEQTFPIVGPVKDLDVGDVDGDGTTDFVYALGNSAGTNDRVGVVLNRSSAFNVPIDTGSVDNPDCIALADVDDDGDLDAVSCEFGSGQVSLHVNVDGTGEKWFTVVIATTAGPADIVANDVDLDGDLDLVVSTSQKLLWLENRLNEPTTSWLSHDVDSSAPGASVAMGDLDGDGKDEIVVGTVNTSLLSWWDRPAVITDPWTETTIQDDYSVAEVDLADVDQDGDLDVLVTRWSSTGDLRYWQNDGSASFTEQDLGGNYLTPRSTAPADFDGDGDLDFAIAGGNSDVIDWIENQTVRSSVTFRTAVAAVTGDDQRLGTAEPLVYGLVDLDVDGDLDIVSYDADERLRYRDSWEDSGTLLQATGAALNDPSAFALADLDNDGDTDVVLGSDDGLEWLQNNGFGNQFSRRSVNNSFATIEDVLIVDFNGDGDLDIVGFEPGAGDLYWWRNTGDGASWFRNRIRTAITTYHDVAAGDVDGSGAPELILAADLSVTAIVYVADTAFSSILIASSDAELVLVRDFDRDGDLDVVGYDPSPQALKVWANDGAGGGWAETSQPFQNAVQTLRAVDVDLDGDLDIAAGSFSFAVLAENFGDGSFSGPLTVLDFLQSARLEVGDLDGDAYPDFLGLEGNGNLRQVETHAGQFGVTVETGPTEDLEFGTTRKLIGFEVEHLGRPGDVPIRLETLDVEMEFISAPLPGGEVDGILARLELRRIDGGQTTIAEIVDPDQFGTQVLTVQPSGGAEEVAPPASTSTASIATFELWGTTELDYDGSIDVLTVRIAGPESIAAEGPVGFALTPLIGGGNAQVFNLVDTLIFGDGFESGSTSAWSSTIP